MKTQEINNTFTINVVLKGITCIRNNFGKILHDEVIKKLNKLEEEFKAKYIDEEVKEQKILDDIISKDNFTLEDVEYILGRIGISKEYKAKVVDFIEKNISNPHMNNINKSYLSDRDIRQIYTNSNNDAKSDP